MKHASTSVIFSDIVGFSPMSKLLRPEECFQMLDDLCAFLPSFPRCCNREISNAPQRAKVSHTESFPAVTRLDCLVAQGDFKKDAYMVKTIGTFFVPLPVCASRLLPRCLQTTAVAHTVCDGPSLIRRCLHGGCEPAGGL